jgi:O-antigen ligase
MQKLLKLSDLSFKTAAGGLLLLYILSTAFLELPMYAHWQHRVQLPELIFVVGFPFLFFCFYRYKLHFTWDRLDLAVGLYWLVNFCAALWNQKSGPWLELIGKTYLVEVYLAFKLGIQNRLIDRKSVILTLKIMAALIFVLVLLGYLLLSAGQESIFLARFADYPYFGTIYRAKALLQTPSMYISVVNWCLIYLLASALQAGDQKMKMIWPVLLLLIAFLSFSKALLLTSFAILQILLFYFQRKIFRKLMLPLTVSCGLVYFLATNFVYLRSSGATTTANTYLATEELPDGTRRAWIPTAYFSLKKAALDIGSSTPFLGVGPGCFIDRLEEQQEAGLYPKHLPLHDPHSVYLGAWAETGIIGVLGLLFLLVTAFSQIRKLSAEAIYPVFLIWMLLFLLEGMNTDLMNFRHYWVQLGLIGGRLYLHRS